MTRGFPALLLCATLALLGPGCFLVDVDLPPDKSPVKATPQIQTVTMPTIWPLKNVFDQQTAVPTDLKLRVRGLHWDLVADINTDWVSLLRAPDYTPVKLGIEVTKVSSGTVTLTPIGGLEPDTRYVLAFPDYDEWRHNFMWSIRVPPPLTFSTRSAPRVIGLWRNGDTLVVVFSEPMDPDALTLASGAADLVYEVDGEPFSVAADGEPADYAWEATGHFFNIAPITNQAFDLVLGPKVVSGSGTPLDTDGDEVPDPDSVFVRRVEPVALPVCHQRDDYPDPCIDAEAAKAYRVVFSAPFVPALDVP